MTGAASRKTSPAEHMGAGAAPKSPLILSKGNWWSISQHGGTTGDFYKETLQLPFSVFSNTETLTPDTIAFIEQILTSADKLVAKALSFFQEQLLISSNGFHLSEEEKQLLSVPLHEVPFECPQFLFYDNKEWILHFAEGGFSFCEPYGVSFHFKEETPILIENLEDAEEI